MSEYKTNGVDIQADFWGVKVSAINDIFLMKMLVKKAIEMAGSEIISWDQKVFSPAGITLTAILSESSFDLHSYPEKDFVAISIYVCGSKAVPERAIAFLFKTLNPAKVNALRIERGDISGFKISQLTKELLMAYNE